MKSGSILFMLFQLILFKTSFSQENYCTYSYKPLTSNDSLIIKEFNIDSVVVSLLKKFSKSVNDTFFVRKFSIDDCSSSVLNECFIKKKRIKKSKLIHVIEHKYSGNRYKLIHYYNSKKQIFKTINKQKKGFSVEKYIAFKKIKYEYNKDGLLIKTRFYLDGFTLNKNGTIIVLYSYKKNSF